MKNFQVITLSGTYMISGSNIFTALQNSDQEFTVDEVISITEVIAKVA